MANYDLDFERLYHDLEGSNQMPDDFPTVICEFINTDRATERDKKILIARYEPGGTLTYEEVGKRFGVSKQRAQQITQRRLSYLRVKLFLKYENRL